MDIHQAPAADEALVGRARALASGTLANALDGVGLHHNVVEDLTPVAPGLRLAGRAVTVKQSADTYGSFPASDFKVGAMIDAAGPGDVIVADAEGAPYSTWGGMASAAARHKGIAGLVVDGAVRDVEEILEAGFPVYSRHMSPTTGRTRLKVEAINVPVHIGGVGVQPGDIVVADGTGIVVLPRDLAPEIVARAERFAADDAAALKELEAGRSFTEVMAKYGNI
ncbi:MAG: RraA family protein [Pseudomonadota bacterium]